MPRVLLIEDHPRMSEDVVSALGRQGIACDALPDARQGIAALASASYDALILDRSLPDGDGLQVLRRLRGNSLSMPCMVLTARDALDDRIAGLEAGADDYLTKPFAMEELVARTKALLRRSGRWSPTEVTFGDIQIDPETSAIRVNKFCVSLSPSELQILLTLARNDGKIVRRALLESAAWGVLDAVTTKALDVAVYRLRGKLRAVNSKVIITNAKGVGYALANSRNG
jgi:DNA-binding response OmpR family regulator